MRELSRAPLDIAGGVAGVTLSGAAAETCFASLKHETLPDSSFFSLKRLEKSRFACYITIINIFERIRTRRNSS